MPFVYYYWYYNTGQRGYEFLPAFPKTPQGSPIQVFKVLVYSARTLELLAPRPKDEGEIKMR